MATNITTPMVIICIHSKPITKCNDCHPQKNTSALLPNPPKDIFHEYKGNTNNNSIKRKLIELSSSEEDILPKKANIISVGEEDMQAHVNNFLMNDTSQPTDIGFSIYPNYSGHGRINRTMDVPHNPITSLQTSLSNNNNALIPEKVVINRDEEIKSLIRINADHFVDVIMERIDKMSPNNRKMDIKLSYLNEWFYTNFFGIKARIKEEHGVKRFYLYYYDPTTVTVHKSVLGSRKETYPLSIEFKGEIRKAVQSRANQTMSLITDKTFLILMPDVLREIYSKTVQNKMSVSDMVIANVLYTLDRMMPFEKMFGITIPDIIADHSILKNIVKPNIVWTCRMQMVKYLVDLGIVDENVAMKSFLRPGFIMNHEFAWFHVIDKIHNCISNIAQRG